MNRLITNDRLGPMVALFVVYWYLGWYGTVPADLRMQLRGR